MKLVWLPAAQADFDSHIDYIVEQSPRAAVEQGDRVHSQVESLLEFPEQGRIGRKAETRELVISGTPFIAVYRLRPRLERVEILFLLHHAERWPKARRRK